VRRRFVVQALGACAGVTLGRAMLRDLYAGDHAARMLSTLLTVMAIAPLLGPSLGEHILALAGWRAIFWTLVGIGAATLAALFMLPETLPAARRNQTPLVHAARRAGRSQRLSDHHRGTKFHPHRRKTRHLAICTEPTIRRLEACPSAGCERKRGAKNR